MPNVNLHNIRSIRRILGVSQSQAARLLGVSTKAIQSYEQKTRSVPPYVQRAAALLIYTLWRMRNGTPAPCWEVSKCRPEIRDQCPAYRQQAGDLCWMLTGTVCRGVKKTSPAAKLAQCQKCAVMKKWLKH